MALSSSTTLSPFTVNITTEFLGSSSTSLPRSNFISRPCTNRRPSPLIVLSSKSGDRAWNEAKRQLMEQYGFDPDVALTEPTRKGKKKKSSTELQEASQAEPKPKRTTHKLLQVLGGKARRMKLLSPKGMDVRPMMEVVKGAAFDILQAAGGCPASLRPGRWLDLYSGTGSVGIEAISRGCSEETYICTKFQVHFVEMDPWVVSEVLRPNLEWTGFLDVSVIHAVRVEKFIERAEKLAGKEPFDYISVTPPYTQVDYSVLMDQISNSALVGENTFIITDRRFGRTHLAIYGPKWAQKKKKLEKSLRGVAVDL
ncbi:uncharacterized protein LOC112190537 isoform X3 [Rosa chinensis]|uniref:uncharacterized protein LOC112190537 isoform X3 n=1 Tax=Rosa chinensis TaxID=74649 RepID=UPI001AD8EC8C|nr:uncharacterized protein LOC112190537 isoform X3 [Rosa chinensis]